MKKETVTSNTESGLISAGSSDSDEDYLAKSDDQGVLGKTLNKIVEEEEKEQLEESESSIYDVRKNRDTIMNQFERFKRQNKHSSINEADEDDEEDNDSQTAPNLALSPERPMDQTQIPNKEEKKSDNGEGEGSEDHPSSSDNESDYMDEEEENKMIKITVEPSLGIHIFLTLV